MAEVARNHPKEYSRIAKEIADTGRRAAYLQGETIGLQDLKPMFNKDEVLAQMDQELDLLNQQDLPDAEKQKQKLSVWAKYSDTFEKLTAKRALETGNNIGSAVLSGSRGNATQLRAMLATPALYTDYRDNPIPLFVRHGFNEGLRPAEYLASTFGVRKSVIATKASTAESGDLGKQMVQSAANLIVTDDDCGATNGLDFDADDAELEGRVMARSLKGIPAGTVIDKTVLQKLRQGKPQAVIARSPMTCQAHQGICAQCLGQLPNGHFAPLGYAAGITAAQAISEPLTQGALNTKHGGGAFKGDKKQFAGFDIIDQIVQSPETFPYRAAVSQTAGRVEKVEDAPQGGRYVYVAGEPHYVLPGFEPTVKPGDLVEAGEQLSEGIVDVADVLKQRGLGEARRYYVDRLRQAFEESGAGRPSKLNLETLARSHLDQVIIDDPAGLDDYLPDDSASYNRLSTNYSPPVDTKLTEPAYAAGKYLQSPTLHFTIGTKLTPKMITRIKDSGIASIPVSASEPKFHPEMRRLRASSHTSPDWMARLHSSYLMANLGESAGRARETNVEKNVHFAPRLAIGKDFGKNIERTGTF